MLHFDTDAEECFIWAVTYRQIIGTRLKPEGFAAPSTKIFPLRFWV
jgi:hypothetical protein